jgi:hypothetical protein
MRMIVIVTVATLVAWRDSAAQEGSVMAQAVGVVTRADPTATRGPLTEGYLTQPVIMAHGDWAALRGVATLDFEGLTLRRGELNTGGYGEGFVDRRHPHSYVHELLLGAERSGQRDNTTHTTWAASAFAGRGFVPFGSDDPMMRPFEKYPVNHHLAQILERVVAVGAVRYGPIIGELATFNGDEPVGPAASPNFNRFGDSWSSRVTVLPATGLEVSGSYAQVASPEVREGHGLDQRKRSVVARYANSSTDRSNYAMAEYAHTDELDGGTVITRLGSLLAEAASCRRGITLAARLERTDRPEEEPTLDPFRTPRPPTDLSNLGVSRWTTLTGSLSAPAARFGIVGARPFIEVARIAAAAGNPAGIFSPELRYGSNRMWMLSAGVRLRAGAAHSRMGRYGAAVPAGTEMVMSGSDMAGMNMNMNHGAMTDRCSQ